jgi:shikimate dehydrogenase
MWSLGVVGSPIGHSLSPLLHEAALTALGLDGKSEAIEIDGSDVGKLKDVVLSHDALSVTMPLKEHLVALCDDIDAVARRVGAVNSVRTINGRVEGRSTDGLGCLDALRDEFGVDVSGRRVVVRGSGGSAKAVVDALVTAGADVTVLARNETVARAMAERYEGVAVNPRHVESVEVVVNTVPVGAKDTRSIDGVITSFDRDACALDLTYVPIASPWLRAQRDAGLRGANGLTMLVHQARRQLEWWFGQPVPVDPLFAAVGR